MSHITLKRISLFIFLTLACSHTAFSESNFDFFFKNASDYEDVIVDRILSTDTIVLKDTATENGEVIMLIGLKAPKPPKKRKTDIERNQYGFVDKGPVSPLTSIEEEAFDFLRDLVEGKHVRLEFDADKKGDKFSTLAYVFLLESNIFVNAEILRRGYADLSIQPPNTKYAEDFREAYKEARMEKRGLQGQ